jgi:glucokinase
MKSPAAVMVDENGNIIAVDSEGGKYTLTTKNEEQLCVLRSIFIELKKLNAQMTAITGNTFSDNDVEE